MDTGFIDALLKNFKRSEGKKEDDKNSIDRCCGWQYFWYMDLSFGAVSKWGRNQKKNI